VAGILSASMNAMKFKSFKIWQAGLIIIHSFAFASCGPKGSKESIKDFRLYVHTENTEFKEKIEVLVRDFNQDSCFEALKVVTSPKQGNSNIHFVKDMQKSRSQIGYGEYVIHTQKPNALSFSDKEVRIHSMNLYFDAGYFTNKLNIKEKESAQRSLKVLFSHEVGHGLEMKHSTSRADIMYESTVGKKDFDPFFTRVRQYFGQPNC
jgi:hypothetical protein